MPGDVTGQRPRRIVTVDAQVLRTPPSATALAVRTSFTDPTDRSARRAFGVSFRDTRRVPLTVRLATTRDRSPSLRAVLASILAVRLVRQWGCGHLTSTVMPRRTSVASF